MSDIIFRQLLDYESFTYTYLLGCKKTKEAVVIDSVIERVDRDAQLINDLDLNLKYILETHIHADHITGNNQLKKKFPMAKTLVAKAAKVSFCDQAIDEGDEIQFGEQVLQVISTPGHTDGCTTFFQNGRLFTGDSLMIRGCGRTDFQQGSNKSMFNSVREKLFSFPNETLVFPAHDYNGRLCSTIGEEKLYNPRLKLTNSYEAFEQIMKNLNLSAPKKIDQAVPANLQGGL